ncbi:MAG: type II toxin-antitoxin system RelE/ParE family toxin [Elusimicrobiota bacterium]|nr:type II toxin-antitoxin system RelE/ParE family toxin [Elusimicrobiota bacterium]
MYRQQTEVFKEWFEELSNNIREEVDKYIGRVLSGNFSNCKPIREGVHEIRINYQKGYRVYFTTLQNGVILLLLAGGNKKRQQQDAELAVKIKDYLKRSRKI